MTSYKTNKVSSDVNDWNCSLDYLLSMVLNSTSRLGILKYDVCERLLHSDCMTLLSSQVSSAKNVNTILEGHDSGQGGEGLDANGLTC